MSFYILFDKSIKNDVIEMKIIFQQKLNRRVVPQDALIDPLEHVE